MSSFSNDDYTETDVWKTAMDKDVSYNEEEEDTDICVSPGEVNTGIRNYKCTISSQCSHLVFSSLDGPNSVKEHVKIYHSTI